MGSPSQSAAYRKEEEENKTSKMHLSSNPDSVSTSVRSACEDGRDREGKKMQAPLKTWIREAVTWKAKKMNVERGKG